MESLVQGGVPAGADQDPTQKPDISAMSGACDRSAVGSRLGADSQWWDTGTIAAAQVRKAQLQAEVAELEATHDAWVKAGMLGGVERCGPTARPCIRVDESAGPFGSQGHNDYRVIQG